MFTSKIFANTRIFQGVKQKSKKLLKKFKKSVKKLNSTQTKKRILAISLAAKIVGVMVVGSVFSAQSFYKTEPVFVSSVNFDKNQALPLILEEKKPTQIVLGESNYQREEREKREQEMVRLAKSGRKTSTQIAYYRAPDPSLEAKRQLVKEAADKFGVDWKVLESVWQVETGKSWDTTTTSYAGATGPMQFMRGTFKTYAVDGNGDGVTDISNAYDAVYTAAKHLATSGAADGKVEKALFNYNHSTAYVKKVLRVADSITE